MNAVSGRLPVSFLSSAERTFVSGSRSRAVRGFTLLELLIALSLLGMMLVLLFGGLRLGMRSWDAAQGSVDTLSTVRAVEGFLRREFSQIHPYRFRGPDVQPTLAFLGEQERVSFVAPMPQRIGGGGLHLMSIALERDAQGQRIVWRAQPLAAGLRDFSTLAQSPEQVLISKELLNVEYLGLSYFGRPGNAPAPFWSERWDDPQRLPALIRVQVRLKSGEPWPEFVVALAFAGGGI
jgi:general secretion pathway protein J